MVAVANTILPPGSAASERQAPMAAAQESTTAALAAYCREQLAGYKCPRSYDIADALPRTGTGKVLKRKLRAPYWAGHDRTI